jgi:ATPase subunit of ABC transporter with duplicated ATPase domains
MNPRHLDLDSIHWLKSFLNRYHGVLIVISHDRHFLDGVCTEEAWASDTALCPLIFEIWGGLIVYFEI